MTCPSLCECKPRDLHRSLRCCVRVWEVGTCYVVMRIALIYMYPYEKGFLVTLCLTVCVADNEDFAILLFVFFLFFIFFVFFFPFW